MSSFLSAAPARACPPPATKANVMAAMTAAEIRVFIGNSSLQSQRRAIHTYGAEKTNRGQSGLKCPTVNARDNEQNDIHTFHALAFVENFSLKDLGIAYPEAKRTHHQMWYRAAAGGTVFFYPSGAVVF